MRTLILVLLLATPALAARLRPYTVLYAPDVRLSDLFAGIAPAPDATLGPAPAPGARILVEAPQLAAIARDYGVDWRPASGAERAMLVRAGQTLSAAAVLAALRPVLAAAGAPPGADIALAAYDPPMLPEGTAPTPAVTNASYDAATGRFTADLAIDMPEAPASHTHLGGTALAVEQAAILTRALVAGARLGTGDLREIRVRASLLPGHAHLRIEQALGQTLRHPRGAGEPLREDDVAAPNAVTRGGLLRLTLDAGPISLIAAAVAIDAGAIGDQIRVQNPSSHATVQALVTGEGEARVVAGPAVRVSLASSQ